jgi:hypothetical protein
MADLLTNVVKDIDGGLYSSRVLGSNGQDCIYNGSRIENTCLFESQIPQLQLLYWDNYLDTDLDLGFQQEGFVTHNQLGEVYLKPNIYTDLDFVDIWIEIKNKTSSVPEINGTLGWFNFDRNNILIHSSFTNISNPGILGTYQSDFGLFMFSDITQKYHAFICNSNGQVFISQGLIELQYTTTSTFYSVS